MYFGQGTICLAQLALFCGLTHTINCARQYVTMFGFDLETRTSWWRYALIYVVSVLGSGLLINFTGGRGIHAGASGAIWGLMTATLVYNLQNLINPAYALRGIAINLIYSFSAGVSWQGHIGGGVAGLLAALVVSDDRRL